MTIDLAMPKPETPSAVDSKDSDEPRYPTTYLDSKEELDLPDEGVMTVKYRKVSTSSNEDEDGECRYSCTLELQQILSVDEGEGPADEDKKLTLADIAGDL